MAHKSDELTDTVLEQLKGVSAATLTTQLFKRGLRNVFIQGIRRITTSAPVMVGPAYTLHNIPAREDLDHLGVFEGREHPQRRAIEEIPPGHVLVMDCRGETSVASGGGILMLRAQIRGAAGVVTDGGLRDTPEIARTNWPVYAAGPSAPTNLIMHHAIDLNVPIGCGGVAVYPGDIIFGDAEGVVVIPQSIAAEVAADAWEQERFERFVIREVEAGKSIFGTYPPNEDTRTRYREWLEAGEPD